MVLNLKTVQFMPPMGEDKDPQYETSISNLQVYHKTILITLKEIILVMDPLDEVQLSNAKRLNIQFGDDRCRVFIDKKDKINYIVFCVDDMRGAFMKRIQYYFDENYAHNMRDIDLVNLPLIWQKENINIIYKRDENIEEGYLSLLPNSFLIQSSLSSGTNIGGNLYQYIHNCEIKNSQESVLNLSSDCCFEYYLKYTKNVFSKQKQIICSNINQSVDQCNLEKRQIMKELQLQCYYKQGMFDKVALFMKKQSLDKIQMNVESFKQIQIQPTPEAFYNKDFPYQSSQIENKDEKQEKQEFFNHLIQSNNERLQKKLVDRFYFKDDLMQKDKDIIMKATELQIIAFKNKPGNGEKKFISVKDLTQMATKSFLHFRQMAKDKCQQEVNLNLMQIYDISLTVDEILLTIYQILEQLNDFAIIQQADGISYELTQKYSKEQLGMNQQQLDNLFQKTARFKSTDEWKRETTLQLANDDFFELYQSNCKLPAFDPNFIKFIGKNIDQIIQKIQKDANSKYKQIILKTTSDFMQETKNDIIQQAEQVLLQPLSLKDKFVGMGLKNPEEASKLIGVNPQSNFNTIEIKSKLEMPVNFDSVFGDKLTIPISDEQKKIEFDKKAISSTSLPLPGGTFNLDDFQMIKQNSDNYYTYANKFNGDKLEFYLNPSQSLDVQALGKKPLDFIQSNYQVINSNLGGKASSGNNSQIKFKQQNFRQLRKDPKQLRMSQVQPVYDLTIKDKVEEPKQKPEYDVEDMVQVREKLLRQQIEEQKKKMRIEDEKIQKQNEEEKIKILEQQKLLKQQESDYLQKTIKKSLESDKERFSQKKYKKDFDNFQAQLSSENQSQTSHGNDIDKMIETKQVEPKILKNEDQNVQKQQKYQGTLNNNKEIQKLDHETIQELKKDNEKADQKDDKKDEGSSTPSTGPPSDTPKGDGLPQYETKIVREAINAKDLANGTCENALSHQAQKFMDDTNHIKQTNINSLNSLSQQNTINIVRDMISNTTSKNVTKNIFKNHYIYEEDDSKSIYTGSTLLPMEKLIKISLDNTCELNIRNQRIKQGYS